MVLRAGLRMEAFEVLKDLNKIFGQFFSKLTTPIKKIFSQLGDGAI